MTKHKECQHCGIDFMPKMPLQRVCSPLCAARLVKRAKKEQAESVRKRKEAAKTIPQLIKEAQIVFNAYVRLRDKGKPCICCGQPLGESSIGGGYDCGHYRSTGSASHLRFNEDNAHAQRKHCNRYGAGRAVDYRIGLIARIGLSRVEALESSNAVHKWTKDELNYIKMVYRGKLKNLSENI